MIINQVTAFAEGTGEHRVRFLDYDGSVIALRRVNGGGRVIPPTNPSHEGLTFQGWNYSQTQLSNINRDIDVGAIYVTSDGKSRLNISLTPVSGLAPVLYLSKSDNSQLQIDWGDMSFETLDTSGAFSTGHTYAAEGDYTITLQITAGNGTLTIGNGSVCAVGGSTQSERNTLTGVHIGSGVYGLDNLCFSGCQSLRYVTMPEGLASIGNSAFNACYSLIYALIPQSISTIGNSLFYNCRSLSAVSIPESITTIGTSAFLGCSFLDSLSLPHIAFLLDQTLMACFTLKSFRIPDSMVSIGSNAFYNCYNLKSLTIPEGVASIGSSAFNGCNSLLKYVLKPSAPPVMTSTNAFTLINTNCRIYVPDLSVSAYKTAAFWSAFTNYIYPASEEG